MISENKNEGFWQALLGIWLIEIFGIFIAYLGWSGAVGNAILSCFYVCLPIYAMAINVVVGIGGLGIMIVAGIGIAKIIHIRISN